MGRDEPSRRAGAAAEAVGPRGRRIAPRPVEGLELRITETIAPGQVFVPFHWAEFNANQVTQSAFDPISREPNYKQCAVRVERAPCGIAKHARQRTRDDSTWWCGGANVSVVKRNWSSSATAWPAPVWSKRS